MTRKDYVAIAVALKSSRPVDIYSNTAKRHQWYADVSAIAELFKRENARFDPWMFFDNCGVPKCIQSIARAFLTRAMENDPQDGKVHLT
jgi:hypothetical protein